MEREVLFKTVHGSRLYGLNHAGSDEDFYTVVTKKPAEDNHTKARYAKQTIHDGEDTLLIDFGTWVEQCKSGVPQALEAMFSDMVVGDDRVAEFREDFRAGSECWSRYLRTIKSFVFSDNNPYKRKRHALRLAINLQELMECGRFNPTLSKNDAAFVSRMAHGHAKEVYGMCLHLVWS